MLSCPYSEFELTIALGSMTEADYEILAKVMKEWENTFNTKETLRVAEHHGISVLELINSPNYEILVQQYMNKSAQKFIDDLQKEGLNNKLAWAFLIQALKS